MPPANNAAPLYLLALADLGAEMDFAYPPDEWQKRLVRIRTLAKGTAHVLKDRGIGLRARTVPLEEIADLLTLAQPAFEKLDDAQGKSQCVFVTGMSIDALLPHAQASRQVARLAQFSLYHASRTADFAEAEQAIRRTLRLSRDLRPRGMLISQLVSLAMDNVVLSSIVDFTLRTPALKSEDCNRLMASLAEHQKHAIDPSAEGFRMEYILVRNTLDDVEFGRLLAKELGIDVDAATAASTFNFKAEVAAANSLFAILLSLADRAYHETLTDNRFQEQIAQLQALAAAARAKTKKTGPFEAAVLVPILTPAIAAARKAQGRHQARLAGTQALVAVRRYQLVHGKLPESLELAAREAGLAKVPADPYSGQPLLYKVIDGKPIVYSVGFDQKDDGGVVDWNDGKQPGDFIFKLGE